METARPPQVLQTLSRERLAPYRIWDALYSPAVTASKGTLEQAVEVMMKQFDRFAIERACAYFHVGLNTGGRKAGASPEDPREILRCLERWPDRLLGCLVLNATYPDKCIDHLNRWIQDGPMVGVLFPSTNNTLPCTHPNFDPIIRRAHELGALIVQHTWFKTGGKDTTGESTPSELVELSRRHPDTTFVCVHAGGEWEKGIRAIQGHPNILVEISGFDPTAGFLEMAVRELGAGRILFARERSFATELAKVLGAEISEADRRLIFGANLRRVLAPMFKRKGWKLT
jgi:predicted TIM-barrel fold metal-dependent hydrolase